MINIISGGMILDDGGSKIISAGVCWGTESNPTIDVDQTSESIGSAEYSSILDGTSHGTIISDGGDSITALDFCWGRDPAPTISSNHSLEAIGNGSFSSSLKGLNVNTGYKVRAYAKNSSGISYSDEIGFKTLGIESANLIDDRDGKLYKTVKIADQWWMAENLNFDIVDKYCYENKPALREIYGGLYRWNEMMQGALADKRITGTIQGVCPAGWHLPTDNEWKTLEINLGMSRGEAQKSGYRGNNEGNKIKENEKDYWTDTDSMIMDEVEFSALPSGIRLIDGNYDALGAVTSFWTSTLAEHGSAWNRHLTGEDPGIVRGQADQSEGFSVRCIKD